MPQTPRPLTWIVSFILLLTLLHKPAWAAPPADGCAEEYVVQANDLLSKIADKFLGKLLAYPAIIFATNEQHRRDPSFAQITNPDRIETGWKLCIPVRPAAEALMTETVASPVVKPTLHATLPVSTTAIYTLDHFVASFDFGPEVDPQWIYESPEQVVEFEILPEHQQAFEQFGYRANYLWNEHLQDYYFSTTGIFKALPPQVKLYPAPWNSTFPRYRYPANVTLPTGLTTNQFGWRGPQLSLDKPKRTIRIACLGASTTVDGHSMPYAYPDFLQHWLNRWSEANGYDVKFEVINFGREGISSPDIAAVVKYEMLPMEVDYAIYYEGSNQFDPRTLVSYPEGFVFGRPPEGVAPNFANVESADKNLLDHLSEYSAIAARARSIVEAVAFTGQEPPKPPQSFNLPEGLDEFNPERARLGGALALRRILNDLDQIKRDLDEHDVQLVLGAFDWFVYDGLMVDPTRHRTLYGYLNRVYWPISYANMRRAADLQNRVFVRWAEANAVPVVDVAGLMPKHPDLYDDAIHNTQLGVRLRAWLNFEALVPLLKDDIESDILPRPDREPLQAHPYITGEVEVRALGGD